MPPPPDLRASLLPRAAFPPSGTAVTAAVSGGADSLALLVLAVDAGCDVTAVYVDHGLREGSAADGEVVRQAAERFGAACRLVAVEVGAGPNLEARARAARRAALPADALTGHTLDDQAETVLLQLLRGAGADGLAGMGGPTKPLLQLRGSETRALCAELGLEPVKDPMNEDPARRRNRVRHELLPLCGDVAERDVAPLLARTAVLLAEESAFLDRLAADIDPTDARALAAAPLALARRTVRRWLTCSWKSYPPDAAAVERVLAVARQEARAADVGGGRSVRRTANRLRIEHP